MWDQNETIQSGLRLFFSIFTKVESAEGRLLIENIAYHTRRLQIQSALNASQARNQLHELSSLGFLLFEEFDQKEAGDLEKNLIEVLKVITKLGQQSKSKEFKKFIADPLSGDLSALKVPDPSDEDAVSEFVEDVRIGAEEIAKIIEVLERTKEALGEPPAEGADKPIKDKLVDDKAASDELIKVINEAYTTSPEWFTKAWGVGAKQAEKEAEGFFGKIKGFFTGLFKKKRKPSIKPDKVAEGILGMSFVDLNNINIEAAKKALIGETKEVAADTTDLTGTAIADDAKAGSGSSPKDLEKLAAQFKDLIQQLAKEDPELATMQLEEPAEELGISVDELQGAIEDPDTLDDLADEKEIDPEDVKAAIEDAAEEADPDVPMDPAEVEELDPKDEIEAAEEAGLTGVKATVADMVKRWADSLSDTSKKSLASKQRGAALQQGIFSAIDSTEAGITALVKDAVSSWRSEHEEALIKSKRFAKKNFASLEDLIPKMVLSIMTRTNESKFPLKQVAIYRFVDESLSMIFGKHNLDPYFSRMNELAGVINEQQIDLKTFDDSAKEEIGPLLDKAAEVVAAEFEEDAEAAEKELQEPASQMGGDIDGADLALGLKYADEGKEDEFYEVLEDGEAESEKVVDVLKDLPGEIEDEEEQDDQDNLTAAAEELLSSYEEAESEDGESAIATLEDPAEELGLEPQKLIDILDDPTELESVTSEEDVDISKLISTIQDAEEELSGDADPEPGEEDDTKAVEDIVDKAVAAAEEPSDDEEAVETAITTAIDDWEKQLSDRQQKRINAKGRLDQLKQAVSDVTPPEVEPPADPADVKKAGDDWGSKNKIDDPSSPLGNPKNFSPNQLKKLIDLFPEIVDDVQGEEAEEEQSEVEELTDAAEDLLASYEELESEDEEKALAALEQPAEEIGIEPDALADILDDPDKFEAAVEDSDVDVPDLISVIQDADEELAGEPEPGDVSPEQEEEIEAAIGDLGSAFEEITAEIEDEEEAADVLEVPAQEIGIPAPDLAAALDDPEALVDLIADKELEADDVIDTLVSAPEELSSGDEEAALEAEVDPSEEIEAALDAGLGAKASVKKALEDWQQSLSKTSQSSLDQKNRRLSLQDAVFGSIDQAGEELEGAIRDAIASWRGEHEEALIKSKRFAKKNFASLEDMVPQMAKAVLTRANESNIKRITYTMVEKAIHNYLSNRFKDKSVLQEFNRMNKLAGLIK